MPICVHCSTPADALFVSYGRTHLVCVRCKACGAFVDPYVEHEAIVVVIDLILVKPRAYRHLLFNRSHVRRDIDDAGNEVTKDKKAVQEDRIQPWLRLARHFLAMLLVDSYLRWFYLCSATDKGDRGVQLTSSASDMLFSYLFVVQSSAALMAALHLTVLTLATAYHYALHRIAPVRFNLDADLARFRTHLVPTTLLLSNLTPTFLLCLLVLWQPSTPHAVEATSSGRQAWQWNEASIDWAIRSLVSGLSAGVGLGVVLPLQRTTLGALMATSILLAGWYVQFYVSQRLQLPFHSGVGVRQTASGQIAAASYCRREA